MGFDRRKNLNQMNKKQAEKIKELKTRFNYVGTPKKYFDNCLFVAVGSSSKQIAMYIGIEEDGHAHS